MITKREREGERPFENYNLPLFCNCDSHVLFGGNRNLNPWCAAAFSAAVMVVAGWVGYEIIHGSRGNVVCVRKAIGFGVRGVGPLWQAEYGPPRMSTLECPETCENATFCGRRGFADVAKFRILQWSLHWIRQFSLIESPGSLKLEGGGAGEEPLGMVCCEDRTRRRSRAEELGL